MADIFISYSSKDREKAEQLFEVLASAGLSVWLDKHGIGAATSWTKEIVDAINNCKALLLLLSPDSIVSHNVIKEVSLASEKRKKIVPLDLEPVTIPPELEYQLAGIQRTPMTNIDAIITALSKIGLEATQAPKPPRITSEGKDPRKSLIIMPFEDLSPMQDNQWFADGLAGELIDMLSKIKSLRILDRKSSLDLRGVRQTTVEIGRLFNTRYFVEGSVRKFGEQIKISITLLDIETGDHLWQESYKGVMQDIFNLQESVTAQVVEGLKLYLTEKERSGLESSGTRNPEAYEFYMKSREYFDRQTKEGMKLSVQLLTNALSLDPLYADAYVRKATNLTTLYSKYEHDPALLGEAESLANKGLELDPDLLAAYHPLAFIQLYRGYPDKAEAILKKFVREAPEDQLSHFSLAYFYWENGEIEKCVVEMEEAARLDPENLVTIINLTHAYFSVNDRINYLRVCDKAIPMVERHLKLHPNDEARQVVYATLLYHSGRIDEATEMAARLQTMLHDSGSLYNLSNLFYNMGNYEQALTIAKEAIRAGYSNLLLIGSLINDENFHHYVGTPEYEEVKRMVEGLEREVGSKSNG